MFEKLASKSEAKFAWILNLSGPEILFPSQEPKSNKSNSSVKLSPSFKFNKSMTNELLWLYSPPIVWYSGRFRVIVLLL